MSSLAVSHETPAPSVGRAAELPTTPPSALWASNLKDPVLLVAAASLLFLSLDFILAPALRNTSFLIAAALFLCLVVRRLSAHSLHKATLPLPIRRLTIFGFLHLCLVFLAGWLGPTGAVYDASHRGLFLAAAKLLVFLPTAVLLDKETWRRIGRHFAPELFASALALSTYFPFRIFVSAWPLYSALLARTVHFLGGLFVTGLGCTPGISPTLTGPVLDVHILFGCSGLDGLRLFQILFFFLLVCDWDRLRRWRTLAGYAAGLGLMLVANAVRIAAMVVLGNRISADLVVRYHLEAGWVYITSVFLLLLLVSYRWLLSPAAEHRSDGAQLQTHLERAS